MNWLAEQCKTEHGVDLTNDRVAMQRLREEAEKAKKNFPARNKRISTCRLSPRPPKVRCICRRR